MRKSPERQVSCPGVSTERYETRLQGLFCDCSRQDAVFVDGDHSLFTRSLCKRGATISSLFAKNLHERTVMNTL